MPWDNLLEALFFGDLTPCEKRHPESPRAQEYWKDCNARMGQVKAKLSEEDVEVLEQMMVDRALIESESIRQGFEDGFRLGVRLLLAALTEEKHD